MSIRFESIEEVDLQLKGQHYLPNRQISSTVFLASRLGKPILVEGPAGTGKTELAKAVAEMTGSELIRLQCYEGLDEAKALYEWDYRKQLLRIQSENQGAPGEHGLWRAIEDSIFSEEFLLERPLLKAIRADHQTVLLIDEVDRLEVETEALLLEILSDFQVSVPELGTLKARVHPLVFLTSNGTRELSEALKRRCLFLFLDYPDVAREKEILRSKVAGLPEDLAGKIAIFAASLRSVELRKKPSISETLDWALALLEMNASEIDEEIVADTLHVLLKYRADIDLAQKELFGKKGSFPR